MRFERIVSKDKKEPINGSLLKKAIFSTTTVLQSEAEKKTQRFLC